MRKIPFPQKGSVSIQELLVVNRKVADQTNLNREQRERNVQGAYAVTKTSDLAEQADLYLIDDLLTTGSSVREGIRALRQAGLRPTGVLTAGVSPRLFS
jgi:predicted amidophosphoribosyltransferase